MDGLLVSFLHFIFCNGVFLPVLKSHRQIFLRVECPRTGSDTWRKWSVFIHSCLVFQRWVLIWGFITHRESILDGHKDSFHFYGVTSWKTVLEFFNAGSSFWYFLSNYTFGTVKCLVNALEWYQFLWSVPQSVWLQMRRWESRYISCHLQRQVSNVLWYISSRHFWQIQYFDCVVPQWVFWRTSNMESHHIAPGSLCWLSWLSFLQVLNTKIRSVILSWLLRVVTIFESYDNSVCASGTQTSRLRQCSDFFKHTFGALSDTRLYFDFERRWLQESTEKSWCSTFHVWELIFVERVSSLVFW